MIFESGPASDKEYICIRDNPRYLQVKNRIEQMWTVHEPYADPHFLSEVKEQFHSRIWEMMLTNTFVARGFSLKKLSSDGPEFFIEKSDKRFWIEAIAAGAGKGKDAVPSPLNLQNEQWELDAVPTDRIILRLTNSIGQKLKKYEEDLQAGRIKPEDAYILAVNGYKAINGWFGANEEIEDDYNDYPVIIKAIWPLHRLGVSWNKNDPEFYESVYECCREVEKVNKSPVLKSFCQFDKNKIKGISAIVYSHSGIFDLPSVMGSDFIFCHNDSAEQKLNHEIFNFGRHYWWEGD